MVKRVSRQLSDPFEFARRGGQLDGEIDARELERLKDVLRSSADAQLVRYSLMGEKLGDKHFIRIDLSVSLSLGCQRCLEDLPCAVAAEGRLLLVPLGMPMPDDGLEDDSFDPVHVGVDFDVLAAVEEELLLALPIAPVHENCEAPGGVSRDDNASPFAVLGRLKRSDVE